MDTNALRTALEQHDQQHVLEGWGALNGAEQQSLLGQLREIDVAYVTRVFQLSTSDQPGQARAYAHPATGVVDMASKTEEQRQHWRSLGLQLLGTGKAAILVLAGGQGTRLGSDAPKGCYDIGLPSHKSLFQLHAERVLRLQQHAWSTNGGGGSRIPLLIMTSPFTHEETLQHLEQHAYFGLEAAQVTLFQQGWLPCFDAQGHMLMETRSKVATAPDGNGGLFRALSVSGVLDSLAGGGVECVDVFSVDNALALAGSPEFLGCCYERRTQCGCRVVRKAYPEERVGVAALTAGGRLQVVEYSELGAEVATARDESTGELLFNWANICMHYFSVPWLQEVCTRLQEGVAHHVARKTIPTKDGPRPAIKLEQFIFDPFPQATVTTLFEVGRECQFAPVKNAPGSAVDSPDTARHLVMALHTSWVESAGGTVSSAEGVEVSPLVSYAGEGLEALCTGKEFPTPFSPELQGAPDAVC